jgi:mgtE-like transporter
MRPPEGPIRIRRVVWEGIIGMLISVTGGVIAGLGLAMMRGTLERMAGMLVMIPPFLDMRGNISGSLSSRLGTALHRGTIKPTYRLSAYSIHNLLGSMVLGLVMSVAIGVFAYAVCLALGYTNAGVISLTLTSFVAGLLANLVMVFLTFFSTVFFFHRGLDPDTVMGPYITTIGDVVSIISLFVAAQFVLGGW